MPARRRKHTTNPKHSDTDTDTDTIASVDDLRAMIEGPSLATYWGTLVPELLVSVLSGDTGVSSEGWRAVAEAWRLFVAGGDARTRNEGQ